MCKFDNFDDYLRADYVIGHDVIGHLKVGTDISRLGLYGPENRFAIQLELKNMENCSEHIFKKFSEIYLRFELTNLVIT